MVARIVCGKNIKGLLLYNENKVQEQKAEFIYASKFGLELSELSIDEKFIRFKKLLSLNKKVKTNAIHISLNFDRNDKLDSKKLAAIGRAYMDKIGFGEQPFLIYQHMDAAHPHLHIVSINIDNAGKRIDLHNIGRTKSEVARKEIEESFGLIKAEGRNQVEQNILSIELTPAIYGQKETKETISQIVREVSRTYRYTSLPEFNAALKHYNIIADRGFENTAMFKHGGLGYSIIEKDGRKIGIPIKASRLPGKPTLKFLEQQFRLNKLLRKKSIAGLRNQIDEVLNARPKNLDQISKQLSENSIDLILRTNKDGRIYGLTYVDHKSRCVLNGSDLGKRFTANGITSMLGNPAKAIKKVKFINLETAGSQTLVVPGNKDNSLELPKWLSVLSQAEQTYSQGQSVSGGRRKRKKKRGRSL